MQYSYEDIYGVDLKMYCEYHSVAPEQLINKTEKDIQLLKARLAELVDKNVCDPLVNEVQKTLKKKEKHLKRLKNWAKENRCSK